MPIGSYSSLGRPLLASGGLDHTVKVWDPWSQDAASSRENCLQVIAYYVYTLIIELCMTQCMIAC
jgi:hypothetical protein